MSRMDSLQKVMRGRKDTLRTLPAFFGEPLNEAADSPLFPEVRTIPCPPGPSGRLRACWSVAILSAGPMPLPSR